MTLHNDIINYMRYLRRECGLYISVHGNLHKAGLEECEFMNHINPYCIKVKSNPELYVKCLECQKRVLQRCNKEKEFSGSCCYGVGEYIMGVEYGGRTECFISVSGYRGKVQRTVGEAAELYDKYIKGVPDEKRLHTLIMPLTIMIEKAFSQTHFDKTDNTYAAVLNYINQNPCDISLKSLCKKFNYSKSYISHMFKKNNGSTIKSYCNLLKINQAAELLRNTDMTVTEAAYTVGFNDLSYFISLFKKIKKTTPGKFKKGEQ